MDGAAVEAALDTALISDAEAAAGAEAWGIFVDPFRLWASAREQTLASLAPDVVARVKALESLQAPMAALVESHCAERRALEVKYTSLHSETWKQRAAILRASKTGDAAASTSLPNFWLKAMQNHPDVEAAIEERDRAALESLVDMSWAYLPEFEVIKVEGLRIIGCADDAPFGFPQGFKLTLTFGPNEFFENTVLTKELYVLDLLDGTEIGLRKSVG